MRRSPLLIVISAPSGGGKTTLCQNLLAENAEMVRAITCTTRQPRPGEKDGVDYYFLTPSAFSDRVQAGDFLEYATVYGNSYGTLKSEVLDKLRHGKDVLLNIDVQGAASVCTQAQQIPELKAALVTVFMTPPDMASLEARLKGRGTESAEVLEKRLSAARQELAQWDKFQYLLVSDTREEDLRRMESIIEVERMRQHRAKPPVF